MQSVQRIKFLEFASQLKTSILSSKSKKQKVLNPSDLIVNSQGGGGMQSQTVKCSPINNINHPKLNARQALFLLEASTLMQHKVSSIFPLIDGLDAIGFDAAQLIIALSTINNYKNLIDETLAMQKNERIANYAFNQKVGR